MTSGLCRDCKHWTKAEGVWVELGVCRLISSPPPEDGPPGSPKAHAMDEDGFWRGHLLTMLDFGCVQFEADGE